MKCLAPLMLLAAAGCIEVDDHLTVNADGSGSVRVKVTPLLNKADADALRESPNAYQLSRSVAYPPVNDEAASELFSGSGLTPEFEYKKSFFGRESYVTTVEFKDVNDLLLTPYARVHALRLVRDEGAGTLRLTMRSGIEVVSSFSDVIGGTDDDDEDARKVVAALAKKKDKLRGKFGVTLPAPITAEGAEIEDKTATWTLKREDAADDAAWRKTVAADMTASCALKDVTFKPLAVPRLDTLTLDQVPEGLVGEGPPKVDVEKVIAAAKIEPITYRVTRTFDLTGEAGFGQNSALLNARVSIPRALAPEVWGTLVVTAVRDAENNDLAAKGGGDTDRWSRRYVYESDDEEEGKTSEDRPVIHPLVIPTRVPPPSATKLALVRGSLDMQYAGAPFIVLLKDAVPAAEIGQGPTSVTRKPFTHPALAKLNIKVALAGVWRQGDTTRLALSIDGKAATLSAVQVYDAKGTAWTVTPGGSEDEERRVSRRGESEAGRSTTFIVLGKPEPPLSLALIVRGGGAVVTLPVEMKDLSILPNEAPRTEEKEVIIVD